MKRPSVFMIVLMALAACSPKAAKPAEAPAAANAADSFTTPTPEAVAAHSAAETKALAACGPVTAEGFCGLKFGMSVDQVKGAWPGTVEMLGEIPADREACFEMFSNTPIAGVSFLVEQGRLGRMDFLNPGPKTADGFGVGAKADSIRAKFGASVTEHPDKYEPEVTDLVVDAAPAKLIFEIQDGDVRAWRIGLPPTIDYVERCG